MVSPALALFSALNPYFLHEQGVSVVSVNRHVFEQGIRRAKELVFFFFSDEHVPTCKLGSLPASCTEDDLTDDLVHLASPDRKWECLVSRSKRMLILPDIFKDAPRSAIQLAFNLMSETPSLFKVIVRHSICLPSYYFRNINETAQLILKELEVDYYQGVRSPGLFRIHTPPVARPLDVVPVLQRKQALLLKLALELNLHPEEAYILNHTQLLFNSEHIIDVHSYPIIRKIVENVNTHLYNAYPNRIVYVDYPFVWHDHFNVRLVDEKTDLLWTLDPLVYAHALMEAYLRNEDVNITPPDRIPLIPAPAVITNLDLPDELHQAAQTISSHVNKPLLIGAHQQDVRIEETPSYIYISTPTRAIERALSQLQQNTSLSPNVTLNAPKSRVAHLLRQTIP